MKILLISPEDTKGSNWGGVSTYTTLLADYLGRIRQDVYVLTPGNKNESHSNHTYHSVRIQRIREAKKFSFLKIISRAFWIYFPLFMKRVHWGLEVLHYVNTHGPFDVIEAPEWGNSTLFVSLLTRQKTIVKLHRGWYAYKKDNELPMTIDVWLVCILEFLSIIFATVIVSPTKYMLSFYKYFIYLYSLRSRKNIKVIPYGIEIKPKSRFLSRNIQKGTYILYVGRIEKAKGTFILIQGFRRITRHRKNVSLVIAGEDMYMMIGNRMRSYQRYLQAYIRRHKLEQRIIFVGKKTREDLMQYYAKCLFVVVPSAKRENSPYVVLEAISNNKSVIASNNGGLPEMIRDRTNGLLYSPNTPEMLEEKIRYLLDHDKVRRQFEKYNAAHKKEYNIEEIALQTLSFYKTV